VANKTSGLTETTPSSISLFVFGYAAAHQHGTHRQQRAEAAAACAGHASKTNSSGIKRPSTYIPLNDSSTQAYGVWVPQLGFHVTLLVELTT
jgi:hypothetical protein